jgi:hypothetical protein
MRGSDTRVVLSVMNLYDLIGSPPPGAVATISAAPSARLGTGSVDGRSTRDLRDALEILAEHMHDAVSRRRVSHAGTESFQRADDRVAYLIGLFHELQRGMAVPDEIWRLAFRPQG